MHLYTQTHIHRCTAYSAGVTEYTDWISVEGQDSPNECPAYDTKQSDDEASVMLEHWEFGVPHFWYHSQVHSDPEWLHLKGSYLWVK